MYSNIQKLFPISESRDNGVNTFDQLCINYVNEKLQNLFIQLILIKEREYYDKEKLDIPFVPFFDNSHIVGESIATC